MKSNLWKALSSVRCLKRLFIVKAAVINKSQCNMLKSYRGNIYFRIQANPITTWKKMWTRKIQKNFFWCGWLNFSSFVGSWVHSPPLLCCCTCSQVILKDCLFILTFRMSMMSCGYDPLIEGLSVFQMGKIGK